MSFGLTTTQLYIFSPFAMMKTAKADANPTKEV